MVFGGHYHNYQQIHELDELKQRQPNLNPQGGVA